MPKVRMLPGIAAAVAMILSLPLLLLAAKDFVMPHAEAAASYAMHDEHADEHVTFGAEPYETPEKAKIFHTDYLRHNLLPVFVVVSNGHGEPLRLRNLRVQLVTAEHAKLEPIDESDLLRRLSDSRSIRKSSSGAPGIHLPIPLPKKTKGLVPKDALEEFQQASFQAHAVEPNGRQCGFFFFDISGIDEPLRGATLYINGASDNHGQSLMYFELPVDKYLENKPLR